MALAAHERTPPFKARALAAKLNFLYTGPSQDLKYKKINIAQYLLKQAFKNSLKVKYSMVDAMDGKMAATTRNENETRTELKLVLDAFDDVQKILAATDSYVLIGVSVAVFVVLVTIG